MNFIILSSSRGTTMKAVLDRILDGSLTATCKGLVSDNNDRGCVQIAKDAGISIVIVEKNNDESREKYDVRLNDAIRNLVGDGETYIACLGWMFIFSSWFVQEWQNRLINVHPSLLPKFPGKNSVTDALEAGETETGMTIHLIDEGVDTGPIIRQKSCQISDGDTEESLKGKIQKLEKEEYPKVLQDIEEGKIGL